MPTQRFVQPGGFQWIASFLKQLAGTMLAL
jgi:hypothetical protein